MSVNVKIRNMNENDIDTVAEMEVRIFPCPWKRKGIKDIILGKSYIKGIIAELDDQTAGYGFYWTAGSETYIANIAVDERHRRKKIGEKLLDFMLEDGLSQNITAAILEVRRSNTPAIEMYKKFGFVTAGVRKKYYADNEDAIIMEKYFGE
ncbi:MAG: ribosomal protein S18-alanine N-acetyltransferase [bacterium]|nr:ribosomal protein S18-alanine N-acetyltransferase [bacterium]